MLNVKTKPPISTSVPQRSVVGIDFFDFDIHDLPNARASRKTTLFADDTVMPDA